MSSKHGKIKIFWKLYYFNILDYEQSKGFEFYNSFFFFKLTILGRVGI